MIPATKSGNASLREVTDEEAWALPAGAVVLVQTVNGVAPWTVDRVRIGVAYTDAKVEQPFEVPVAEGHFTLSDKCVVRAIPDLYTFDAADPIPEAPPCGA